MNNSNERRVPSFFQRVTSVWYRHIRVYSSSLISNSLPPFLEPLIFLAGLGIGVGKFVPNMGGISYTLFLASGLLVTSAMYTASFECTYETFVRLEFDYIYDGMLGSPLSTHDVILGELLYVGTKGLFFSFAVLVVLWVIGIIRYPLSLLTPLIGFLTGIMFGTLSLLITAFIKNMSHFNFFFTGLLTPMFFFSGVVFPIESLPGSLRFVAELIPLTHVVRMARELCVPGGLTSVWVWDFLYCIGFTAITGWFALKFLRKRMIA